MKHPQSKPQSSFDVDRFIEEAATAAADKSPPKRRGRKKATPKAKAASGKAKPEVAPREPVIDLDLGKVKRKQAKNLKRGAGPLLAKVHHAVASVHHELGEEAAGRKLVPVVVLYERKRKKKRGWLAW